MLPCEHVKVIPSLSYTSHKVLVWNSSTCLQWSNWWTNEIIPKITLPFKMVFCIMVVRFSFQHKLECLFSFNDLSKLNWFFRGCKYVTCNHENVHMVKCWIYFLSLKLTHVKRKNTATIHCYNINVQWEY